MVVMGLVGHLQAFWRKVSTNRNMASDDQLSMMECPAPDSPKDVRFLSP